MRDTLFHVFKIALSVAVPLASLATGVRAAAVDPLWLFKRPGLLLRSLLAIFVLVPVGTVAFVQLAGASRLVASGLVVAVLAVGIGPPMVFKRTHAKDAGAANVAYEVELNVVLLLLAIAFIPAAVALLGVYFHRELHLDASRVAVLVLTRALIPLVAGVLLARFFPRVAAPLARVAGPFVQIILLAVVVAAVAVTWRELLGLGARAWLVCAAVALGALVVGHLCGGRDVEQRRVLSSFSTLRFPALALLVASAAPLGRRVIPVVLAYVISGVVLLALYGRLGRTGHGAPPSPSP